MASKRDAGSIVKRAVDIGASLFLLVLLAPLLAAIALAVVLDSGFPAFYSQVRVGRGFRRFRILKFRTMRSSEGGAAITVAGDRRITRLGGVLRALKLDELPQLWNVLKGDMSLVGPRPELPQYVAMFEKRYRSILAIRPGITDLASIRFRNEAEVLARAEDPGREYVERILPAKLGFAEEYLDGRSLSQDIAVLLRTLVVTWRLSSGESKIPLALRRRE